MFLAAPRCALAQPNVQISQLPTQQVRISWSQAANGFLLEVTPNVGPNAVWTTVDVTPVPEGANFTVTIPPGDDRRFYRLRQALEGLTALLDTSPEQAETGVAVTRETVVRFSGPLAANTAIDNQQFFAQFGARRILSRIHLSTDRQTLTLFYLEPLPSGARVRVTLKGDAVKDSANRAVDLDRDGVAGGDLLLDFDTLSLAAVSQTAVSGRVFASQLKPSADGTNTFVNVPLGGVTITVDGMEQSLRTVTDGNGNFRLEPVPAGEFFVHIDGRTVTNLVEGIRYPDMAYYPNVGKKWESVAGQNVNLGEIYLPLIPADTLKPTSIDQDTTLTFNAQFVAANPQFDGVSITVPANSLFNDNGTRGGMVGIAPVPPDRLPGPLPEGLPIQDVITIQTDGGSNFDQPVPACFPNLPDPRTGQKLPPGAKSALWSFNHDTGRFEVVGSATVSADGKLVCTDPGVGILAPGWHGTAPGSTARGGRVTTNQPPRRPWVTNDVHNPFTGARSEPRKDDCDGNGACGTGRSVMLHNGEERFERVDLAIPGRGEIHFELKRVYRSRLIYDGPIGYGWSLNYNEGLWFDANGDVIRLNGRARLDRWTRQADGSFKAPAGDFRDFRQRDDGSYVLRSIDGFSRYYRADGRMFSIEDRFGNRMLFDYDARGNLKRVIDVYGREIEFTFQQFPDGTDRLVRVKDFVGREVVYTYDGRGDLVAVRTPVVTGTSTGNDFPNGRTEKYTYSSGFAQANLNHNLLSVTFPEEVANNGPAALSWTYGNDPNDEMTFDAVLTETYGGTNASGVAAGGTMVFEYEEMNMDLPMGDPEIPRMRVRTTLRNGNKIEYFHNELDHDIMRRELTRGLRPGEPAYFETKSYYDEDGQLVRQVFPEGNEVRYTYQRNGLRHQRQNLVETRQIAGPRGGGPDLVTTFTYEPLYNQIASVTEARGNDVSYTPSIGQQSAARYTKRFFYDYQESSLPIPLADLFGIDLSTVTRGLGDLNGDGRTDQLSGKLVRVEAPTVLLRDGSREATRIGSTQQRIVTEIQWNDQGQILSRIDPEGNVIDYRYFPESDPDGDGVKTFAPYVALRDDVRNGYLEKVTVDSRVSPRRDSTAPAPAVLETLYAYDAVGNMIGARDPRGVWTRLEINALNEVVSGRSGADVSAAVQSGQLITGESALSYNTRYFYDANGRLTAKEVENRGQLTPGVGPYTEQRYEYDILGQPVSMWTEVNASGGVRVQYRYDAEQLLVRTIQGEGNVLETIYDERNLPMTITRGAGTADAATIRFDYDRNGNKVALIDGQDSTGDGQPEVWRYEYDGFDRHVASVDPVGNRRVIAYDPASNEIARQVFGHTAGDPGGLKVLLEDFRFHYDELNRLVRTDQALFVANGVAPARTPQLHDQNSDGFVTTLQEFDRASRPTFFVEDDGETHRSIYDGAHRRISTIDPLGNTKSIVYDKNSNPVRTITREVSPDGLIADETFNTIAVFDQLDRLVRRTDNAGQTVRYSYDARGNLVGTSDAQGPLIADPLNLAQGQINDPGNTGVYVYDGLNRLVRSAQQLRQGGSGAGALDTSNAFNADGEVTVSYEWDGNSRLTAIRDDNNNVTAFRYDALDRVILKMHADTGAHAFVYDKDDNLTQVTDPNNTVVRHNYDALNRLTRSEVVQPGTGVAGTRVTTYDYDGLSRRTRSVDDNGDAATRAQTSEFIYDSLSRVIEERQNGRAISTAYSGDSKRLATIYPSGRRIDRTYDAIDRVRQLREGASSLSEHRWIGPSMRELLRTHGNQTSLSYLEDGVAPRSTYDAAQRVTRQRVLRGPTAIIDREYGNNRADRRTSEKRHDDGGLADAYTYDSLYRIIRTDLDLEGTAAAVKRNLESIGYALDGVGNRRQVGEVRDGGAPVVTSLTLNVVNQYAQIGAVVRLHSRNGNLLDDGVRLYTYDYRDRLIAVRRKSDQSLVAEYLYDSENRRREKRLSSTTPGGPIRRTQFFYDRWQVCEEQNALGQAEVTYVYAPGYIDALLQMQRTAGHELGAGTFYLHQNARYDVVAITDASGSIAEKTFYDDFGRSYDEAKQRVFDSAVGNPFGFQGARLDSETGLYYFRNRYYDPETGRFLQRDPEWDYVNAGNQYTFAGNSPLGGFDPFGLQSCPTPTTQGQTRTRPRPPAPVPPPVTPDGAQTATTAVRTAANAVDVAARAHEASDAVKGAREAKAAYDTWRAAYNESRFSANMAQVIGSGHTGADLQAQIEKATAGVRKEQAALSNLQKTSFSGATDDVVRNADNVKTAGKAAAAVGHVATAAEVAMNAMDYYNKDERLKKLSANERERILAEYDRLVRHAMSVQDPCLKEKLIRDLQENMEYQLNNTTDSQITEHLMNGAVFVRDSLASLLPLPTGWLWGNSTEERGRP